VWLAIFRSAVSAGAASAPDALLAQQAHISQGRECPSALNAWEELYQTLALLRPARTATPGLSRPTERQCAASAPQASSPRPMDAPCPTGDARTALRERFRQEVAWAATALAYCAQQARMLWKGPPRARNAPQENRQAQGADRALQLVPTAKEDRTRPRRVPPFAPRARPARIPR
jgi:hypothetical protein